MISHAFGGGGIGGSAIPPKKALPAGRSAACWGRAVRGRFSNTTLNEGLPENQP